MNLAKWIVAAGAALALAGCNKSEAEPSAEKWRIGQPWDPVRSAYC